MKTEQVEVNIKTVNGRELADFGLEPLTFTGPYEAYETIDEVKAANDMPSDKEVVAFRNTQLVANARAKYMKEMIEKAAKEWKEKHAENEPSPFAKPTVQNDPKLRWFNTYDAVVAAGRTPEEAVSVTKIALGLPEDYEPPKR